MPPSRTVLTRRHVLQSAGIAAALGLVSGCATAFPDELAAMQWPPIGDFVEADGVRIHFWDRAPRDRAAEGNPGQGKAPVVLIHGASGNLRDWTYAIAPKLARERRVIAFDRPGFGYSQRQPELGWRPEVQARALRAATRSLGVARPIVVGHSLGAAVAMAWAADAPRAIAGVVAVSGVTMPYSGAARVFDSLGLDALALSIYTEYMKARADQAGVERFIRRVFTPQTPPPGYADFVGGPLALREETLVANAEDIAGLNEALLDLAPRYATLRTPVEILHGTEDFISLEAQATPLSEVLPNARVTLLPGIGHMAHHAATDELAAALARIDQLESTEI